jgi:alpha-glucosidase (family GH31 glycosyl hydrolase)
MIRIEISPNGLFEDRPSQVFWYRNQPIPTADVIQEAHFLSLETASFFLTYRDSSRSFTSQAIEVQVKGTGKKIHIDDKNPEILPGTARTLDETNGPVKLQPGIISRSGWVLLDDTSSLLFTPEGWLQPRSVQKGYRDLYLLVYGQDYKAALRDYQQITGFPSLLPRAMLGNWWSRFWEYAQDDIQHLVEHFQLEQIPLSVFIIDMDWHITKTENACTGWTGFSWNRELFPDPPRLLEWLHRNSLLTSLNLHPAEGIHPHEGNYPLAAREMGMDPQKKVPLSFNISDPLFTRVYFSQMLHPLEEQGVDFWWIDWQQGDRTDFIDLDPLWWLNHLHYYDLARDKKKRPVIFSRWGGNGNHRYPIGFSGDTIVSWKSLAYQPYFTATATNAAYGWWSHDIGGHMHGKEDKELYIRWIQFGVLSPIFRLHSTKDPHIDRLPWAFTTEILNLARQAMQFRHALVPYIYTMSRRNEQEGLPLVIPLYYEWPSEEAAYEVKDQYLFGSELMAAPVTSPIERNFNLSRKKIWFPPGEWFDFFTGVRFSGPQWRIQFYRLDQIPLFVRAGAIIPLAAETTKNGCALPSVIDLIVFPGKNQSFKLFEDDGISMEYLQNGGCTTEFLSHCTDSSLTIKVLPATGDTKCLPQKRTYRIIFRGVNCTGRFYAHLEGQSLHLKTRFEDETHSIFVEPVEIKNTEHLTVGIHTTFQSLERPALMKSFIAKVLKTFLH